MISLYFQSWRDILEEGESVDWPSTLDVRLNAPGPSGLAVFEQLKDDLPMQQPLRDGAPTLTAPSFYLTRYDPVRPGAILAATFVAVGALCCVLYALGRTGETHLSSGSRNGAHSAGTTPGAKPADDDKDDPSQVDTIVLGDPADAPVPARRGDHVSTVHPTILVHLPRFGEKAGLIPNTPAGRLLYAWLAAFNKASYPALAEALPGRAGADTTAAQMELRQETGGFALLSAKEVQPGVLVFRLRDQTPSGNEALGTLQVRPDAESAAIASISIRTVIASARDAPLGTDTVPTASRR